MIAEVPKDFMCSEPGCTNAKSYCLPQHYQVWADLVNLKDTKIPPDADIVRFCFFCYKKIKYRLDTAIKAELFKSDIAEERKDEKKSNDLHRYSEILRGQYQRYGFVQGII